jgi:hypothetical protein
LAIPFQLKVDKPLFNVAKPLAGPDAKRDICESAFDGKAGVIRDRQLGSQVGFEHTKLSRFWKIRFRFHVLSFYRQGETEVSFWPFGLPNRQAPGVLSDTLMGVFSLVSSASISRAIVLTVLRVIPNSDAIPSVVSWVAGRAKNRS